ncbi:MAG: MgtC/SapB family protein [Methylococcaceae bacterium]|nr:MgtC/SapB family protein [Methylococcaceae bacterium]
MTELENFQNLGVALAIGLLISLERGWHARTRSEGMRIAGLRTYGIIAMLGNLLGVLALQTNVLLTAIGFLSLTAILLVAYSKSLSKFEDFSITSVIATLVCFTLGTLTVFGHAKLASSSAVVIALLLSFKPLLHGWMNKLEQLELEATLKLLLISVVMLPILPDRGFGPWEIFNPYLIWWMVVLIAGISYLGYFSIKIVGDKHGPVLTGLLGGLVSSTAVTLNLARLSKGNPAMRNAFSAGILTACATMFVRSLVLASIVNRDLLAILLPALSITSIATYLLAFILWRRMNDFERKNDFPLENPFQLGVAIKFAVFLIAILFLSRLLKDLYGNTGTYALAALSGIADVDPIILSMSQLSKNGLDLNVAAHAIFIAVSLNSLVKSIIAIVFGDRVLGFTVAGVLTLAISLSLILT